MRQRQHRLFVYAVGILLTTALAVGFVLCQSRAGFIRLDPAQPMTFYVSHERLLARYRQETGVQQFDLPVYLQLEQPEMQAAFVEWINRIESGQKVNTHQVTLEHSALQVLVDTPDRRYAISFDQPNQLYITNSQRPRQVWICHVPRQQFQAIFQQFSSYDSGKPLISLSEIPTP